MKVLYFTSTGNSLWVARQFDGNPLSIVELADKGEYDITDEEAIGVAVPSHVSDVPKPVRDYLRKATLRAPYIFGVITYGSYSGSTAASLLKLIPADYINSLLMVDNYFPLFNQQKQIENSPQKHIEENLRKIREDVSKRVKRINDVGPGRAIAGWLTKKFFPLLGQNYRRFHIIREQCTRCNTCARVCPMNNIVLNPYPSIGSNCIVCGACRQNCPVNCIRFKGEKDTCQFRNPGVSLRDIIASNSR